MRLRLPEGTYKALIFDCDGTLVDSMPLHHKSWSRAISEAGARFVFDWELFISRAGMGLSQTVLELNAQFGESLIPEQVILAQRSHYETLLSELRPIETVVSIAKSFEGPKCVASGGEKPVVLQSLRNIGIVELFQHVVCQEDVRLGKPDPEMFLRCAELMGVEPHECLVFEDGALGIEAARRAGMAWVAVDGTERCEDAPLQLDYQRS